MVSWLSTASRVFLLLSAIFLITAFVSGFEGVKRQVDRRDRWVKTSCNSLNITSQSRRCCIVDACQCQICNLEGIVPCSVVETSSTLNQSSCCGPSECCATECTQTCYDQQCYGTGNSRTCYQVPYCCQKGCSRSVPSTFCSFHCGTCTSLLAIYVVNETGVTQWGIPQQCGLNDVQCVTNYRSTFSAPFTCWYDMDDINDVRLDKPSFNASYKAGMAFLVIGSVFFAVTFSAAVWYVYNDLKYLKKSRGYLCCPASKNSGNYWCFPPSPKSTTKTNVSTPFATTDQQQPIEPYPHPYPTEVVFGGTIAYPTAPPAATVPDPSAPPAYDAYAEPPAYDAYSDQPVQQRPVKKLDDDGPSLYGPEM